MRTWITWTVLLAALLIAQAGCQPSEPADEGPRGNPSVLIETNFGKIEAELWPDRSPKTVANFLKYVDDKHYDNLIFHRVRPGFMIQGGGFDLRLQEKPTRFPEIMNEATAANRNLKGTLAMARTNQPHSASCQFFINLVDNGFLDHTAPTQEGWGYCVFGQVTRGMGVVEAIGKVKTHVDGPHEAVPDHPVIIKSIRRME